MTTCRTEIQLSLVQVLHLKAVCSQKILEFLFILVVGILSHQNQNYANSEQSVPYFDVIFKMLCNSYL